MTAMTDTETPQQLPGYFIITSRGRDGTKFYMTVNCPCGCGREYGYPLAPDDWDGNQAKPTMTRPLKLLSGCYINAQLIAGVWKQIGARALAKNVHSAA